MGWKMSRDKLGRDAILHELWTKAVGTPGYDKKKWQELEKLVWEGLRAIDILKSTRGIGIKDPPKSPRPSLPVRLTYEDVETVFELTDKNEKGLIVNVDFDLFSPYEYLMKADAAFRRIRERDLWERQPENINKTKRQLNKEWNLLRQEDLNE